MRSARVAGTSVCFIIDALSRRIVGWRVATNMRTSMVFNALDARPGPLGAVDKAVAMLEGAED